MTPEGKIKKDFKHAVSNIPKFWYFSPVSNGMGVMGIPDFVCCYQGRFIGVETKAPGRRGQENQGLSALQVRVKNLILAAGGWYFIIDDKESLDNFLYSLDKIAGL
jgi:hypothetical protein